MKIKFKGLKETFDYLRNQRILNESNDEYTSDDILKAINMMGSPDKDSNMLGTQLLALVYNEIPSEFDNLLIKYFDPQTNYDNAFSVMQSFIEGNEFYEKCARLFFGEKLLEFCGYPDTSIPTIVNRLQSEFRAIQPEDGKDLGDMSEYLPSLIRFKNGFSALSMVECQIKITENLKLLDNLQVFYFSYGYIENYDFYNILFGMNIKTIRLRGNHLDKLPTIRAKNLKILEIDGNRIPTREILLFSKLNPSCKIICDGMRFGTLEIKNGEIQ